MSSHTFIPTIALVGGIGSGKSAVANKVKALRPVKVVDADQIGHEILNFPEVLKRIRTQFGTAVFDEQGKIERSKLAKMVFGEEKHHQQALEKLEEIVHPEIHKRLEQEILSAKVSGTVDAILVDAAVILEAGWNSLCDQIVFIECPFEQRLNRVIQNRGWSSAELKKRENHQLPLSEKRTLANYVIHNDDNLETAGAALSGLIDTIHNQNNTD